MDKIYSINGPVITVANSKSFSMMELVYVGDKRLMGEVISMNESITVIQVYESTTGLKIGEPVVGSGSLLSATLGPGLLTNIFDGIERPLRAIEANQGSFIKAGEQVNALDQEKKWDVTLCVEVGQMVNPGMIFATCDETSLIQHRSMVPPNMNGVVVDVKPNGAYSVNEPLIQVKDDEGVIHDVCLAQRWPIRTSRPVKQRYATSELLVTGQRVVDTLFPIAKGGAAAIPGGFGAGKTMMQHQLAKWCDADIIVYVGCGERGNEMTQVLEEFGELIDPKSGKPLLDRTVLIANTSNMPVAAREASIYTGVAIAEYYRDMGYHVAMMADSTSRWAEALREISGRLEEMPAEEGFPAYLPSRIAQFYERAGYIETLNDAKASVTLIGAVSPAGGDFSEPVTQNTKRFVRCFWALDKALAYARHYPSVNWNLSYSEYKDSLSRWFRKNVASDFEGVRDELVRILHEENELNEIVKLIGSDVLPEDQRLTLEVAKLIRVGFLQQNAFHAEDTFVPLEKQYKMAKLILYIYHQAQPLMSKHIPVSLILKTGIFDKLVKIKYDIKNNEIAKLDGYYKLIDEALASIQ